MELKIKSIIEIMGKPKEHVEETMQKVIEELSKRKNIIILDKKVAKAKELETFFSTYADLEIKLTDLDALIDFCFDFLPSSIEIVEPDDIILESAHLASFMNDLLAKLHHQSMVIRNLHAENILLKQQKK